MDVITRIKLIHNSCWYNYNHGSLNSINVHIEWISIEYFPITKPEHTRYELARAKEREEQDALRADEDQRKTIIEEERRRRVEWWPFGAWDKPKKVELIGIITVTATMIITMMDGKHQEWSWIVVVVTDSNNNDTNASGGSAWYPWIEERSL